MKNISILLAFTILMACEEGNSLDDLINSEATEIANQVIEAEGHFLNVYLRIEDALRNEQLQNTGSATIDGAQVRLTNDSLLFNFGNVNVLTADNRTRRGKISCSLNANFLNTNSAVLNTVTSQYFVDDKKVDLQFQAFNDGNSSGAQEFRVENSSVVINNGELTLTGSKRFKWVDGFGTILLTNDDVFHVTGSSNLSIPGKGLTATANFNASDPVRVERSCSSVVTRGLINLDVVKEINQTGSLDFIPEDGCNNLVRVSLSGNSLTLPFDGF